MRICFVGVHTHVHTERWYQYFVDRGHDVRLLSTICSEQTTYKGLTVYPFPLPRFGRHWANFFVGMLLLPFHVYRLKRLIQKISPDVLHVHYINDAALCAALTGFHPLILTAWGTDILISPRRSRVRRWIVRYILKRADLVTSDADHMQKRLIELGSHPNRCPIVFFGTDVDKYSPARRDQGLRGKLSARGFPLVISIRNHEPVYDLGTFLRAAQLTIKSGASVEILLGGSGTLTDDLKKMVMEMKIEEHVRFLGKLDQRELPTYLASSDVYVSTALSDGGLAASTAEAMAVGVPVVVTDVGNNRQWVEDGREGYVVPPQDPQAVSKAILELLGSSNNRLRMGQNGRTLIENKNNFSVEMSKMEALCLSLIPKK